MTKARSRKGYLIKRISEFKTKESKLPESERIND